MADDRQRNRTPTLSEVLLAAIEAGKANVYTTLPGKIDTYDPVEQKADVIPMLLRPLRDEDGNDLPSETLPIIPSVPVRFPRADAGGGRFFQSWPMKPGDAVTLHHCKWSIDQWAGKVLGDPVDPAHFRQFDLGDAFAVPGLYPFKSALKEAHADDLVLGLDDGGLQIHIKPDSTIDITIGGAATEAILKGNAFATFWDDATPAGVAGNYNIHTHPTAMGPSGPPTPTWITFLTSTLSAFFKIDGT